MKTFTSPLLGFPQHSGRKLMLILCTCINYEEITLVEQSSAHCVSNKCKLNG